MSLDDDPRWTALATHRRAMEDAHTHFQETMLQAHQTFLQEMRALYEAAAMDPNQPPAPSPWQRRHMLPSPLPQTSPIPTTTSITLTPDRHGVSLEIAARLDTLGVPHHITPDLPPHPDFLVHTLGYERTEDTTETSALLARITQDLHKLERAPATLVVAVDASSAPARAPLMALRGLLDALKHQWPDTSCIFLDLNVDRTDIVEHLLSELALPGSRAITYTPERHEHTTTPSPLPNIIPAKGPGLILGEPIPALTSELHLWCGEDPIWSPSNIEGANQLPRPQSDPSAFFAQTSNLSPARILWMLPDPGVDAPPLTTLTEALTTWTLLSMGLHQAPLTSVEFWCHSRAPSPGWRMAVEMLCALSEQASQSHTSPWETRVRVWQDLGDISGATGWWQTT